MEGLQEPAAEQPQSLTEAPEQGVDPSCSARFSAEATAEAQHNKQQGADGRCDPAVDGQECTQEPAAEQQAPEQQDLDVLDGTQQQEPQQQAVQDDLQAEQQEQGDTSTTAAQDKAPQPLGAAGSASSKQLQLGGSRNSGQHSMRGTCARAAALAATAAAAAAQAEAADAVAAEVSSSLQHVLSLAPNKRANLHLLEDGTLAMAAGCAVLLLHLPTMQQRFLPGRDGGGVAAVAVHPSRKLFLVAEKCRSRAPNIFVYSHPDLVLRHTLPAGTERAYSAACFSPDGTKLAAVGSSPDYLLTLWDWAAGATLLRCKAFSQEVYGLGFCPHSPGRLVSCGTGHIRFWKLASTFTGLKLQGALGRFGAVELSDVAAFVELPDGKVLSGSETGDLLLWEGGLIKAVICRPGGARCHDGPIEVLMHDASTNYLISGGGDGLLRLWEVAQVQDAEPPEGSNTVSVKPAVTVALTNSSSSSSSSASSTDRRSASRCSVEQVSTSDGSSSATGSRGVRGLVQLDARSWLVQSEAGALSKVTVPLNILDQGGYSVATLMQLQAGGIVGCRTCPDRHVLLAAAADGTISALDYRSQSILQHHHFSSRISSMAMMPQSVDPQQRCMVLGFADGCVRLAARCNDGWAVLAAARPHKVPVVSLAVGIDGCRLAALAADGSAFFLLLDATALQQSLATTQQQQSSGSTQQQQQQQQQLAPLVSCQLGISSVSCCCWYVGGTKLLVGTSSGVALEVEVPQPGSIDTSRTYQHELPVKRFQARPPRQRKQQQQQQPSDPSAVQTQEAAAGAAHAAASQQEQQQPGQQALPQAPQPAQQQPPTTEPGAAAATPAAGAEAATPAAIPAAAAAEGSAEGFAEAEADDVDEEELPVLPVTRVAYQPGSSSDTFLLWLGGPAAGQVLTCSWGTQPPSAISSTVAVAGAAVSVCSRSWSGAYQLTGTSDGQVRLEEVGPAPRSWQCALHDMHDGSVTGLAMAFDDSCLISAAADGTLLLLHNALGPPLLGAATTAAAAPALEPNEGLLPVKSLVAPAAADAAGTAGPAQAAAGAAADTVTTAEPLSLEEAKQAARRGQKVATAAAARQQLLGAVEELRAELEALVQEDAARPPAERLPSEAFHLDAGLPALVQRERQQRLASAQAQVAYDAEVAALKLSKLQAYFDSTLQEHVVTVHAFGDTASAAATATAPAAAAGAGAVVGASGAAQAGHNRSVCTIRPPELPGEVLAALKEAEAAEAQQQEQQQQQQHQGSGSPGKLGRSSQSLCNKGRTSKGSFKARISQEALGPDASMAGSSSSSSAPNRSELWRQAKRKRAAEWAAFNASRPDDTFDAPEDVAALQHAAATVGDFKLKSNPGFTLPDGQRWTPARKRHQMLQLMRQLSEARTTHNAQVLTLRQRKRELVARLNSLSARLAEVNKLLGITEPLPQQSMQPDEEPEEQLTCVTEAQLAEHVAAQKAAADKAAGLGVLGGFAAAAAATGAGAGGKGVAGGAAGKAAAQQKQQQQHGQQGSGGSSAGGVQGAAAGAAAGDARPVLSQPVLRRLQVERQQLLDALSALPASFNTAVSALRATQLQLAVDLKATEGRLLMLLQELALLKGAGSGELALEAKRAAKLAEADELAARMVELEGQLDGKRAEGEAVAARRAALVEELGALLAEHEGFREALTKVFNRRIKRGKRHGPGSTVSGAGSSDDGSDGGGSDLDSDGGSDSDRSSNQEVCPPGCDPALYDAVTELREHRLEEEEAAAEVAKALEALGKDRALLAKKAKLVDTSLAAINQEVLDFQVDKQARLNQLPATVSLRRRQLALLGGSTLPTDAATAIPAEAAAAAAVAAAAAGEDQAIDGAANAVADGAAANASLQQLDLSDALVFSSLELERLQQRMQELDQERDALKQHQKELRRQHKQMQEDKAVKEARLAELTTHCTDVQLLKFGQVIDVSMLDGIGLRNKSADELREVLKGQGSTAVSELAGWDGHIAAKRRELVGLLRENTAALTTVTDLTRSHRELEKRVLAGRSELWSDPLSARRATMAEQDRLVSRISSQANQLDALRVQLAAMRRKDSAIHG